MSKIKKMIAAYLITQPPTIEEIEMMQSEPEIESSSINKFITIALTVLVLGGIILIFYSAAPRNTASVPPSTPLPENNKTSVATVAPVATAAPVNTVPETQPTGKRLSIKLDRNRGFYSLIQGTLTINPGDEVVWINEGIDPITLVSSDGLFEAKLLDNDKRTNYIFKISGTYRFYLKENINQNATIIIEP